MMAEQTCSGPINDKGVKKEFISSVFNKIAVDMHNHKHLTPDYVSYPMA